eukprot:3383968-Pyramimonas_sp.AAC.1
MACRARGDGARERAKLSARVTRGERERVRGDGALESTPSEPDRQLTTGACGGLAVVDGGSDQAAVGPERSPLRQAAAKSHLLH